MPLNAALLLYCFLANVFTHEKRFHRTLLEHLCSEVLIIFLKNRLTTEVYDRGSCVWLLELFVSFNDFLFSKVPT